MTRRTTTLLFATMLVSTPAWAVHKCKLPDGKVVYQDTLCNPETTSREQLQTWDNNGYIGHRKPPAAPPVEPDAAIKGPPEAQALLELYGRWIDAERLAMATSRINLAAPAATLQALRREVKALQPKVATCAEDVRQTLETLIHKSAEAILQFMSKDSTTALMYQHFEREQLIKKFEREIKEMKCS